MSQPDPHTPDDDTSTDRDANAVWTPPRSITAKIVSWVLLLVIAVVLIAGIVAAIVGVLDE